MTRAGVSTSWWSAQEAQQCPLVVLVVEVVVGVEVVVVAPAAHQSQHRIRQRRIRNRLLSVCAFYIFISIYMLAMLRPDSNFSRNGGAYAAPRCRICSRSSRSGGKH